MHSGVSGVLQGLASTDSLASTWPSEVKFCLLCRAGLQLVAPGVEICVESLGVVTTNPVFCPIGIAESIDGAESINNVSWVNPLSLAPASSRRRSCP